MIYCQLQTWERVHVTPASEKNVVDTGKADFLAVHVKFSSKWNMKKSSRLFCQCLIRQNKIDLLFVEDNKLRCVSGSSFSVSRPNTKPMNKIFLFYSALEYAVLNISSS